MASATKNTAHMSPEAENRFEDKLQGDGAGNMDDWEAELAMKVLDIEHKITVAEKDDAPRSDAPDSANPKRNTFLIGMLRDKLVAYHAAIKCIRTNAKVAMDVAGKDGLKGLISYFVRKAKERATEAEVDQFIAPIQATLPGVKLQAAIRATGLNRQSQSSSSSSALAY